MDISFIALSDLLEIYIPRSRRYHNTRLLHNPYHLKPYLIPLVTTLDSTSTNNSHNENDAPSSPHSSPAQPPHISPRTPQPFYLAAREAVTPDDRAWVRQKHRSMTEYYREQQRNMAMRLTERVWEITDELQLKNPIEIHPDQAISTADRQIKALDAGSCLFIF